MYYQGNQHGEWKRTEIERNKRTGKYKTKEAKKQASIVPTKQCRIGTTKRKRRRSEKVGKPTTRTLFGNARLSVLGGGKEHRGKHSTKEKEKYSNESKREV